MQADIRLSHRFKGRNESGLYYIPCLCRVASIHQMCSHFYRIQGRTYGIRPTRPNLSYQAEHATDACTLYSVVKDVEVLFGRPMAFATSTKEAVSPDPFRARQYSVFLPHSSRLGEFPQ